MTDADFNYRYNEHINFIVAELLLLLTEDVPMRRRDNAVRRVETVRMFVDQLESQMDIDFAAGYWYRP